MNFNRYSHLAGKHAFLSASNYHWINYDEEKLDRVFFKQMAAIRGTEMHALAHQLIRLAVKLPSNQKTLNRYVNDAIGYRMTPEQILYYSDNCFGTSDCICFRNNTLRIHDLKTGSNEASMTQLKIYAALFCLEYNFTPIQIEIELRIYQNDDVKIERPDPDEIFHIIDKIKTFDARINELKQEVPF